MSIALATLIVTCFAALFAGLLLIPPVAKGLDVYWTKKYGTSNVQCHDCGMFLCAKCSMEWSWFARCSPKWTWHATIHDLIHWLNDNVV